MANLCNQIDPLTVAAPENLSAVSGLRANRRSWVDRHPRLVFLLPSFTEVLFVALLVVLFGAGKYGLASLLADGDAGWHIRTGEFILDTHTVPRVDQYSFTKAGQPWYAWEWLSDVVYAVAFRALAMKGVVLLAALVCVTASVLVFLFALWRGGSLLVTLALAQLATGVATIHFLARPHVFTLLLLVVSLWMLDADRRKRTPLLWLLAPLTALWTNLHGGFLSMIACVGLLALGTGLEGLLNKAERRAKLQQSVRYGMLALLSLLASFVNPYGWQLHMHTAAYLRSDWIKSTIEEFMAPHFRSENELQLEVMLILGLLCCGLLLRKGRFAEVLLILFWAHQSLTSIRHATIYVLVAMPIISSELSGYWQSWSSRQGKHTLWGIVSRLERDMKPAFRRPGIWFALVVVALVVVDKPVAWPKTFPEQVFPIESVARHRTQLAASRVLTTDEWGDYLLFVNYPRQKVFIDGRSDFYGPQIGNDYMALYVARYDWKALLAKYNVESIFIPVDWPLATVLKSDSRWRLADDDGRVVFFERANPRLTNQ